MTLFPTLLIIDNDVKTRVQMGCERMAYKHQKALLNAGYTVLISQEPLLNLCEAERKRAKEFIATAMV